MGHGLTRWICGASIAGLLAGCTHNPATNKPMFDNFNQCMAANTAGSIVGSVLLGGVTTVLTGKKAAGVGVGIAAASAGIWLSWQRCAAVYQKVENTEVKPQNNGKKAAINKLTIDTLDVVAGKPGEELRRTMRYTLTSADSTQQDIPVKETTVLQVPRVASLADNSTAFVDQQGKPLVVAGKTLRPGQTNLPADQLVYDDFALPADVTIRPGIRKSDGQLPTDPKMPADRPYRLKMVVAGLGMSADKTQTFYFRQK
ncbi:MAG: hypothetical protein HYZ18_12950 [Pseudogulbenkiania sp.]|nr:hypothetical protein [Pseudogulbenkiania sp.]